MDWRQAEILDLISMYRESECLWNCLSTEYKDADLKKNTWKEIADHFERDVVDVKKKIKNLRTNFVVEKKKVESKKKTEPGEPTYEPRLFYYDELTFLDPVVFLRASSLAELQQKADDLLIERRPKRSIKGRSSIAEKRKRIDSIDEQIDIERVEPDPTVWQANQIHQRNHNEPNESSRESPQLDFEKHNDLSKEETFCAMICSELKLIKSEDTYDNVTLEIFSILKNAKMAERQIEYQPEEDSKIVSRRT